MRGKVFNIEVLKSVIGITPAYAGKSFSVRLPLKQGGDHPRLCGEKFSESLQTLVMIGSPPPMRGKD